MCGRRFRLLAGGGRDIGARQEHGPPRHEQQDDDDPELDGGNARLQPIGESYGKRRR
jgi:hypothetical protein